MKWFNEYIFVVAIAQLTGLNIVLVAELVRLAIVPLQG